MRQLLGPKKVRRLRAQTGLPVVAVLVRGGTDHRLDLCLADGRLFSLYRDGELEEVVGYGHAVEREKWVPLDEPGAVP